MALLPPSFNHLPPFHPPNPSAADDDDDYVLAHTYDGFNTTGNNSLLAQEEYGAAEEFLPLNNNYAAAGGGGIWKVNLPMGVRFRPTDVELINYYLRPFSVNPSLNHDDDHPITEARIYDYDPHHLLGLGKDHGNGRRYFYTKVKKIGPSKTRRCVKSNKGCWKPTQKPKVVKDLDTQRVIGFKRPLAFHEYEDNFKTQWLMQEYTLETRPPKGSSHELVLAVVYYHRRRKREDGDANN